MNTLFKIRGLVCGYNNHNAVLQVPSLDIDAGKTLVVLGKSGSGKSTFLETLALMNNTYRQGSIYFSPSALNGKSPMEFGGLWGKISLEELAKIRCRHFSFIFQQTNLMPNFTVFENIYITRLMQGYPDNECKVFTKNILTRLGLSTIDTNRKVTELSGGQRQRVAFARAIVSSFDVLFGDEPTGYLDEINSIELLQLLRENIQLSSQNQMRTAIIVTHSIALALHFADTIIVITRKDEESPGVIKAENMFHKVVETNKSKWTNGKVTLAEKEFESHLRKMF